MEDKKYAIYTTSACWTHKDSPKDHPTNGTSFTIMYKEDPGIDGARQKAILWWDERITKPEKLFFLPNSDPGPSLEKLDVRLLSFDCFFSGFESWCLTWFSHYSFNVHLSDDELLVSFASFVDRKIPFQHSLDFYIHGKTKKLMVHRNERYCLMGAEDPWRWKGPCRCKSCTEQGIVRIDH